MQFQFSSDLFIFLCRQMQHRLLLSAEEYAEFCNGCEFLVRIWDRFSAENEQMMRIIGNIEKVT